MGGGADGISSMQALELPTTYYLHVEVTFAYLTYMFLLHLTHASEIMQDKS